MFIIAMMMGQGSIRGALLLIKASKSKTTQGTITHFLQFFVYIFFFFFSFATPRLASLSQVPL